MQRTKLDKSDTPYRALGVTYLSMREALLAIWEADLPLDSVQEVVSMKTGKVATVVDHSRIWR